ncbi:MAG: response regulator [Anaerolineales bacterium]|nr:response regulator [Anaerolineales bacterium]
MTILIVDDSSTQRLALAALLEDEGYTDLLLAGSAAEALHHFKQNDRPNIDLILMDLHMPLMNGIEACRQIKAVEARRDIPIIMVTSSTETEDLQLAFTAGAMDYITKPPNEVELLARVRSALKLKHETDQRKARERDMQQLNQQLEQVLIDLADKHKMLMHEQEKSERLLLNILPKPVANRLKQSPEIIADHFEAVTVLFADIVGFTTLSAQIGPEELVKLLNDIFSRFDGLADRYGLEKIKTIGDAYMAVAGLPMPRSDHAAAAAEMALGMQREIAAIANGQLQVRIGLHSGPVVAGVIGKKKFSYDLWGDTVNTASRMESHGLAGQIQVTQATYEFLQHTFLFEPRGAISVKGKGELPTYLLMAKQGVAV